MPAAAFSDATRKLFLAAKGGSASEVRVRNAPSAGANLGARDEDGRTPLHLAAANNPAPSVIMALAEAGADPRAHDEVGNTPLHLAAMKNDARAIVALTRAGTDPGERDEDGATPFGYARRHNEALRGTNAYWRLNEARFK